MYDFTVLIMEGAFSSSVAVTRDVLASASALAPRLGVPSPRWQLCSLDGGDVQLQGGMSVQTARLPAGHRQDASVWVLPGLGLNTPDAVSRRLAMADVPGVIDRLTRHAATGGQVAASCSAVFMLHAAGLLEGRRATTTWWLAPLLQSMSPDCLVDADRMICADGPVVTAGAAMAQTDLMLHLLRERSGPELATLVSRMMLIDGRPAQASFVVPEMLASGDDLVMRLAAMIERALPNPPSVSDLASAFCMSGRTLSRHIHRATGKSTVALVRSIRLRRARSLLETSRMTVEQVAEAVGYKDSTALRRLMKQIGGANPSSYRAPAPLP